VYGAPWCVVLYLGYLRGCNNVAKDADWQSSLTGNHQRLLQESQTTLHCETPTLFVSGVMASLLI
jgi:hypothetical protein